MVYFMVYILIGFFINQYITVKTEKNSYMYTNGDCIILIIFLPSTLIGIGSYEFCKFLIDEV